MILAESPDPLVDATWALVWATLALALVGGMAALFAFLAYRQTRRTDEFAKRNDYRERFMGVYAPLIGELHEAGIIEADGKAHGWDVSYDLIQFIRGTVDWTAKHHPVAGIKADAQKIGNQIVRDQFADWVADGRRLTKGKTRTLNKMRLDFQRKMHSGEIANTEKHPDFDLSQLPKTPPQ